MMSDSLEGYPEYQEFLPALLTLKLCQVNGGKLKVCASRMIARYSDPMTISFINRMRTELGVGILLNTTWSEFVKAFK